MHNFLGRRKAERSSVTATPEEVITSSGTRDASSREVSSASSSQTTTSKGSSTFQRISKLRNMRVPNRWVPGRSPSSSELQPSSASPVTSASSGKASPPVDTRVQEEVPRRPSTSFGGQRNSFSALRQSLERGTRASSSLAVRTSGEENHSGSVIDASDLVKAPISLGISMSDTPLATEDDPVFVETSSAHAYTPQSAQSTAPVLPPAISSPLQSPQVDQEETQSLGAENKSSLPEGILQPSNPTALALESTQVDEAIQDTMDDANLSFADAAETLQESPLNDAQNESTSSPRFDSSAKAAEHESPTLESSKKDPSNHATQAHTSSKEEASELDEEQAVPKENLAESPQIPGAPLLSSQPVGDQQSDASSKLDDASSTIREPRESDIAAQAPFAKDISNGKSRQENGLALPLVADSAPDLHDERTSQHIATNKEEQVENNDTTIEKTDIRAPLSPTTSPTLMVTPSEPISSPSTSMDSYIPAAALSTMPYESTTGSAPVASVMPWQTASQRDTVTASSTEAHLSLGSPTESESVPETSSKPFMSTSPPVTGADSTSTEIAGSSPKPDSPSVSPLLPASETPRKRDVPLSPVDMPRASSAMDLPNLAQSESDTTSLHTGMLGSIGKRGWDMVRGWKQPLPAVRKNTALGTSRMEATKGGDARRRSIFSSGLSSVNRNPFSQHTQSTTSSPRSPATISPTRIWLDWLETGPSSGGIPSSSSRTKLRGLRSATPMLSSSTSMQSLRLSPRLNEERSTAPAPTGLFGMPLGQAVHASRITSSNPAISSGEVPNQGKLPTRSQAQDTQLPRLVSRCIQSLEKWGLDEEGIYRISGRSSHSLRLRAFWDNPAADLNIAEISPADLDVHSVCSVLKMYLRELPERLIPVEIAGELDRIVAECYASDRLSSEPSSVSSNPTPSSDNELRPAEACVWDERAADLLVTHVAPLMHRIPSAQWFLLRELAEHLGVLIEPSTVVRTKMPLSNLTLVLAPTLQVSGLVFMALVQHRSRLFTEATLPTLDSVSAEAGLSRSFSPTETELTPPIFGSQPVQEGESEEAQPTSTTPSAAGTPASALGLIPSPDTPPVMHQTELSNLAPPMSPVANAAVSSPPT
ncbi:hypothetical protein MYAM1_000179 [Malassezia yamatoensis]|uniref:Rho-GAP domain-containing protein n=1 Tax=Malassezia yamatoensis TaxID=253288 RepID=A0AAJ6CFS8_9BASI|nr:hypothetical protein MYAM1_000179 [Malassezia yamatoensis]